MLSKGPSKPGRTENKWSTSATGLCSVTG